MPEVYFGRKDEPATPLEQTDKFIAVRTHRPIVRRAPPVPGVLEAALPDTALVASFPEVNVGVYRVPEDGSAGLDVLKSQLRALPDVRFAGRVLVDQAGEPVVYTENLFIKFVDEKNEAACLAVIVDLGLSVKRKVDYAANAWFVAADGAGQEVFNIANELLKRDDVEFCHPEIVRRRAPKAIYPQQWHLSDATVGGVAVAAHAHVASAHEVATGEGITIAIIDDGVDIDHPEFVHKIVAPRDVTLGIDDPRPKDSSPFYNDDHGTACAGVACAAGMHGASGVAPSAKLMPIRLASSLGAQAEAEAFKWAADNGADVISCSWGPPDGDWRDPDDPAHTTDAPMPAFTRLAIDYVTTNGREGRGCVVLFAAGNGNEDVRFDGYASYGNVIAVAACNDRGFKSAYSDYGDAVWCAFPSNDRAHEPTGRPQPLTPGIWTTDRVGAVGYNSGSAHAGDAEGFYTNGFGGTSSACPGVAGVVALMLSVNPSLSREEVRDILREACDRIDEANGDYDGDGWSAWYGWGRVNAARAVELAGQARSAGTGAASLRATSGWFFDAPARVKDFSDPKLWHEVMAKEASGIVRELVAAVTKKKPDEVSDAEIVQHGPTLGYVDPVGGLPATQGETVNVVPWSAFPLAVKRRLPWPQYPPVEGDSDGTQRAAEDVGDEDHRPGQFEDKDGTVVQSPVRHRQDEYCEWVGRRDAQGRLIKAIFVAEGYDYYAALFKHDEARAVDLYREFCEDNSITADDLRAPRGLYRRLAADNSLVTVAEPGAFNPRNRHNIDPGIVHLSHRANSLSAEVNLAGVSGILRLMADGQTTLDGNDPRKLLCCCWGGNPNRDSDPRIAQQAYAQVRQGFRYTLADPVGLYIASLEADRAWTVAGDPLTDDWWRVVRGDGFGDVRTSRVLRLELAAPAGSGLTLDDLTVDGEPVRFPGQLATLLQIHLFITRWQRADGSTGPSVPCVGTCCRKTGTDQLAVTDQPCAAGQTLEWPDLIVPAAARSVAGEPVLIGADARHR